MQVQVELIGITDIVKALEHLKDKTARRIGRACVNKMAMIYAGGIRKEIPKSIRPKERDRGIGYRTLKGVGREFRAKVGIRVGKAAKSALKVTNRGKRKGVGVSANNLHWFALGTKKRYAGQKTQWKSGIRRLFGSKKHFTGAIDKAKWGGFVERGIRSTEAKAFTAAMDVLSKKLPAEVAEAKGR